MMTPNRSAALSKRLDRIETRMSVEHVMLIMPDNSCREIATKRLLSLLTYAMRMRGGYIPVEKRRPDYDVQLKWILSACEVKGDNFAHLLVNTVQSDAEYFKVQLGAK